MFWNDSFRGAQSTKTVNDTDVILCAHTPVLCEGFLGSFFFSCSKCGKDGPEGVTEAEARSAWAKAFKVQSQSIKPKHSKKRRGW